MTGYLTKINHTGITSELIQQHSCHVEPVAFKAGDVLFKPNDSCRLFLILIEGSIRVELTSKTGRLITLYRMCSGESCVLTTSALLNNEKYYAQGIAETDITAVAIPANDFRQLLQLSPTFSQFVLNDYAKRVTSIVTLIDKMAARDVLSEVSEFLLSHQKDNTVVATQADIAMDIGSAREVVSRKLAILESKGLIQRERGRIVLHDCPSLVEITES